MVRPVAEPELNVATLPGAEYLANLPACVGMGVAWIAATVLYGFGPHAWATSEWHWAGLFICRLRFWGLVGVCCWESGEAPRAPPSVFFGPAWALKSSRLCCLVEGEDLQMAIAVASIMQESNDFSPVKTRYEDFGFLWGRER